MTLKGKNKFLRSIIVCLVAVAFVAGIAGVVYSQNNASVKVEFKGDTWNTNKEFGQKQWFMNANENEVKFIVDLSDYKMESTGSEGSGGEDTTPPVEPEQPENQDTEEPENPPLDGVEEGNETPDNAEVVSEGEDIQPDEDNGDVNTPENNETTEKVEIKYPKLEEVMDINIITENITIEPGQVEFAEHLEIEVVDGKEIGVFKGKYEVTIPLNKKDDFDQDIMVETDFNINVELTLKGVLGTEDGNVKKSFNIVKDVTTPTITITGVSEGCSGPVEDINISLDEDSNMYVTLEKIKDDAAISVITEDIKNTKVFNIDASNYEDGKYRLSVVAIDKAGNEVIKQVTFNVNKHAPIVKFNGESLKHFYNSKETEITIDINDGNKIDYKNSKVIIKGPNGFKYEGNFAGDNSEVWSDIVTLGEDGEYTVFVKTKDELSEGEVDKEDDVDNFTKIDEKFILDTKAPQINVLTLDGDDYKNIIGYPTFDGVIYLNNDNIKFELNKADELKEFKAKFNGDLNEEITDISAPVKLEDGTYELTITAKDEAGNEAEVQVINFIVDTDPVDVKFDGDIKNGEHYNTDKTLVVTLGGNNLNLSQKNNRVEIVKDGGQPVIEFFDKNEDTFIKDFTEEGAYTVTVFATDKAGNEAIEENTITFTIDKTEPVIIVEDYATLQGSFNKENKTLKIIVNEANLQEDSAINLTYTIPTYDEDGNEVEAKEKVINLLKAEHSSGVYRIEYVVGEDINWDVIESINYAVKFNVKDKSGNQYILKEHEGGEKIEISDLNFTIDKKPARVSINHNGKKYNEENEEYYISAKDDKTIQIIFEDQNYEDSNTKIIVNEKEETEADGWNKVVESNKATYSKSFDDNGIYNINVLAKDKAGNESSDSNKVKLIVDNHAPTVSINMDEINLQSKMEHFFGISSAKSLSIKIKDTNIAQDGLNEKEVIIKIYKDDSKEPLDIDFTENNKSSDDCREFTTDYFSKENTNEDLNGLYKVIVVATDKAGNIYNESEEIVAEFTIDNTRPIVSFDGVEEGHYFGIITDNEDLQKKNNITVVVKDDNISEINSIEIKNGTEDYIIKELNWIVDSNSGEARLPLALIEDGHYEIKVNSTDKAGNEVIENNTIKFTIDNEKPEIGIWANVLNSNNELGDAIKNEQHINIEEAQINVTISDINLYSDLSLLDENANNYVSIKRTLGTETKDVKKDDGVEVRTYMDKASGAITVSADVELEGTYTIVVNSNDKANNKNNASFEFTIDRTNPEVVISNYDEINGKFLGSNQNVEIKVTELNYNDGDIKVNLSKQNTNGEFDKNYERSEKANVNSANKYTTTEDGKYIYTVTGKDKAGNDVVLKVGDNKIPVVNLTFVVDTKNPEFKISGLDRENNHYNVTKDLTITVTDDNQLKNEVKIFKASKEGENLTEIDKTQFIVAEPSITEPTLDNYGNTEKVNEYKYNFKADQNNDGYYKIEIVSTDIIGNNHNVSKTWMFTIDSKSPVISFNDFNILNGSFRQSFDKVTVNIDETNINHDDTNMVVSYTKTTPDGVTSDSVVFRQRTNTATYTVDNDGNSLFADADAIYTFTVSGVDAATNEAVTKTISFTKDATKPEVSITGVEEGEHYNTDKHVKILSHDVNHEINTVTVTKDGQSYSVGEFSVNGRDAVINHTFSQEGEYVITLYSKDKAGNDNTTSKSFTIDKTAPVITPVFKGENREIKPGEYINKIFTPEFKLDKAEDKFDFITLNEGQNVTGAVPMSSTEMVYHYTGQASDKAGNITPLDITFTVDVTNPEVKVTGIIDGFFSEDMKPEYEITDTNLDNANTSVTLNDKEFKSGTKIEEQDYYSLKLLGTDLATNTTARNIVFAIDKDKPVIKFLEEMSGKYFTEDFIPNFIIEDLTDYTIIAMTLDGVDYEIGDPITEEGKHVLYIEVKDKAENVESISVEFILDKTPPKFIVNGIKNKEIYVEPVTAEITLENPLDKITGVTVNGELAQGDVKEENGQQVIKLNFTDINDYEVVLKAVDEAGNETEEVINFKIVKKNIFTTIYANKAIFYPLVAAIPTIAVTGAITVVRKNKKKETQEEDSEE